MAEEKKEKLSLGAKIKKFFGDYKSEFKKISWPSKADTMKKTAVVLVAIVIISICVFLIDAGLNTGFGFLATHL